MAETPNSGQSGGVSNTGNMSAGGNIVGGNMTVNTTTSTMSKTEIAFQPIAGTVKETAPAMRPAAEATLASLKKEVEKGEKGEKPDDTIISGLLKGLVGLVPSAASAIVSAFGTPILGAVMGPATKLVLEELGMDQK
jgi:hypothetical protein